MLLLFNNPETRHMHHKNQFGEKTIKNNKNEKNKFILKKFSSK